MATRKKPQKATAEKLPHYTGEQLADLIRIKSWIHKHAARVLRFYASVIGKGKGQISDAPDGVISFADDCVHWAAKDGPQDDINHARLYLCFVATLIENNDYLILPDPSFHYNNLVSDYEAFHPPEAMS